MIIIGEKISVIAKKVREALTKFDPKPLQDLAVAQVGAQSAIDLVSQGERAFHRIE